MTWNHTLVVRKKNGKYRAAAASVLPLKDGWEHVKDFGSWSASQTEYKPYKDAVKAAFDLVEWLNKEAEA